MHAYVELSCWGRAMVRKLKIQKLSPKENVKVFKNRSKDRKMDTDTINICLTWNSLLNLLYGVIHHTEA